MADMPYVRSQIAPGAAPDPWVVDQTLSTRTLSARVEGAGAVSAEITFEGSTNSNSGHWETIASLSLSGTDSDSDAVSVTSTWPNVRAHVTDMTHGAVVTTHMEAISSAAATATAAFATGGLFGGKTIVVSTTGNDTAGAASPYAAEFLTIQAAMTAATAGDSVLVRPGSYAMANYVLLKTGVGIHFLPGAIVTAQAGNVLFYDGAVAKTTRITGHGQFICNGGSLLVEADASSFLHLECEKVSGNTTAALIQPAGSAATISLLARSIDTVGDLVAVGATDAIVTVRAETIVCGGTGVVAHATGTGPAKIVIEATRSITGAQILVDAASTGATRVSIKAPTITATIAGQYGVSLNHASATAEYDIEADVLVAAIDNRVSNVGTKLRVNVGRHTSQAGSGAGPLAVQGSGETFYRCIDMVGITGGPQAIHAAVTATLHLLGGRIRGLAADAGGHAILTSGGTVKIRLYPGVVLIAGSDGAAGTIEADNTPTVLAMGAIAANKAANVGVVVAVGSLLVDAAVV